MSAPRGVVVCLVLAWLLLPVVRAGAEEANASSDSDVREYLAGNGLLNRGLFDLAAAEYRKFLDKHPQHDKAPVARYGLGVCLYRTGQPEQAIAELDQLTGVHDFAFAAETATIRGQCHLALKQYEQALASFDEVASGDGDHDLADDAAAGAIECQYALGRLDDVLKRAKSARRNWPASPLRHRVEFFVAMAQLGQQEYTAAGRCLTEWIKDNPDNELTPRATLHLAQCRRRLGETEQAAGLFRAVLEGQGDDLTADALLGLGEALLALGNAAEAAQYFDRLIATDPKGTLAANAHFLRGKCCYQQEQYDRAVEAFVRVPDDAAELADDVAYWKAKCALRLDNPKEAARLLADASEQFPASTVSAEIKYDQAVALLRADQPVEAGRALQRFRTDHPDHPMAADALHLLAVVQHQQKAYGASAAHCGEFLDAYPRHGQVGAVRFLQAENAYLSSEYAAARDLYDGYLRRHGDGPEEDKARYRLGMCCYHNGASEQAEQILGEVVQSKADPSFRGAYLALGNIYFDGGKYDLAEQSLAAYVQSEPSASGLDDAILRLGIAQQRQDKHEAAIQSLDRLLNEFPDSQHRVQAQFERGQTLAKAGRADEAAQSFEQVLALGPDSEFAGFALNHLGSIASSRGDFETAARRFQEAGSQSGEEGMQAEVLFQLGQAQMGQQQYSEACASLQRFLERFGDHKLAPQARAQLAIALARSDKHEEAVQAVEAALQYRSKLTPQTLSAIQYERAWCLRTLGRKEQAREAYRQLVNDAGETANPYAVLDLASLEMDERRFAEAAELLKKLVAEHGDSAAAAVRRQAQYRLGVCEFELERFGDAASHFEQTLQQAPGGDEVALMASAAYYAGEAHFRSGNFGKAVEHLQRVVESYGDEPVYEASLLRLGEALAQLQHWPRSEQAFEQYLDRFAKAEHAYQARFGIGWARENQQRYEEAIQSYQQVVAGHQGPTAARAQFQIGECLFAQNKFEEAATELMKVEILYAYAEWSAAALYEAGRCFARLNRAAEAKQQFDQVVSKYKDTRWAELAQRESAAVADADLPGRD